jgi:Uma2 family endonuclease
VKLSSSTERVVAVTISPLPPAHLLTIAEYAALGEDEHGRTELMEGNLVMSPGPTPAHARAVLRMGMQLASQLPDHVEVLPVKRAEYADAGIPHYWIVDLDAPGSLVACRLTDSGYRDERAVTGTYSASEPFPVRLDLDALR